MATQSNYMKVRATVNSQETFTPVESEAEAVSLFIPAQSDITLHFAGKVEMHEFENEVSFELRDATGGIVQQKKWTMEESQVRNIEEDIPINNLSSGASYSLQLYARVVCGDNPQATSELEVSF